MRQILLIKMLNPAGESREDTADILKKIRIKHSRIGNKRGNITEPVHRREFYELQTVFQKNHVCAVKRFYFPNKKNFTKALDEYYKRAKDRKVEYKQVGYAKVNLRFCCRCHDAEKTKETDLYFVNIFDDASQIRETLCYGCIGAIVKEMTTKMNSKD